MVYPRFFSMCVLVFGWNVHPRWTLVVAGNRDELHARPAHPLFRWNAPNQFLAGRDIQSGGTWLSVSEKGSFGVVTNLRGYGRPRPGRPSRGVLLRDITSEEGHYRCPSNADLANFNPFNLIVIRSHEATFLTNHPTPMRQPLRPGTYALANGALDEPWLKTVRLKHVFLDWMDSGAEQPAVLLDALREDELPGPKGGAPMDILADDPLSPIFINSPVYGTRCSTIVAIDKRGHGSIVERSYGPGGQMTGETALSFHWLH
jgi:uncharacterized protein with NRDE domain